VAFHLGVERRVRRPLLLCFLLRFSQGLGVPDRIEEVVRAVVVVELLIGARGRFTLPRTA
jgi:hypothetical protein